MWLEIPGLIKRQVESFCHPDSTVLAQPLSSGAKEPILLLNSSRLQAAIYRRFEKQFSC
jgi:hypothetical protein